MKIKDNFDKLWDAKKPAFKKCSYCQCTVSFFKFEKKDKKIGENCNRYVFKDEKAEFKYRLKEKMLKR